MEKEFKTVCAWCPDNIEKTKKLKEQWHKVSHGICDECLKVQMEIIDKIKFITDKKI